MTCTAALADLAAIVLEKPVADTNHVKLPEQEIGKNTIVRRFDLYERIPAQGLAGADDQASWRIAQSDAMRAFATSVLAGLEVQVR